MKLMKIYRKKDLPGKGLEGELSYSLLVSLCPSKTSSSSELHSVVGLELLPRRSPKALKVKLARPSLMMQAKNALKLKEGKSFDFNKQMASI